MKRILALIGLMLAFAQGLATAQNSSPYVLGQWNLEDKFKDSGRPELDRVALNVTLAVGIAIERVRN